MDPREHHPGAVYRYAASNARIFTLEPSTETVTEWLLVLMTTVPAVKLRCHTPGANWNRPPVGEPGLYAVTTFQ